MKTKKAIRHFGGIRQVAEVLGITRQAVEAWGESVPELRAFQLERLTGGVLQATPPSHRRRA